MEVPKEYFEDPISLNTFVEPIVIPTCGHTIERSSILQIQDSKCPVCRKIFIGDPLYFPINWSIANILGLNIKINKSDNDILELNAMMARNKTERFIEEESKKTLKIILDEIDKLSSSGNFSLNYKNNLNPLVKNAITKFLKAKGYCIYSPVDTNMTISW